MLCSPVSLAARRRHCPPLLRCRELREQMLAGTLSPECCLVNAELVPELRVLHVAAHKALAARRRGALRTRTLHSELIFNLSGSKQVRVYYCSSSAVCAPLQCS